MQNIWLAIISVYDINKSLVYLLSEFQWKETIGWHIEYVCMYLLFAYKGSYSEVLMTLL